MNMMAEPFNIKPSQRRNSDRWAGNQTTRNWVKNEGYWIINEGEAKGTIVGGNLCTFNLLQGTEYFPNLKNTVLFIEDDSMSDSVTFDRDLQSIIHQPNFEHVKGIVIGRFENDSHITKDLLTKIIKNKREITNMPVIANVDFGHTAPILTIPIGGSCEFKVKRDSIKLEIISH